LLKGWTENQCSYGDRECPYSQEKAHIKDLVDIFEGASELGRKL